MIVFVTAPKILAPIRKSGIDRAEWTQQNRPGFSAIFYQSGIHSTYILMKHAVETPHPGLSHAALAELL
jgi:hypothetical protein